MKIEKCTPKQQAQAQLPDVSYEEALREEGIYATGCSSSGGYVVVARSGGDVTSFYVDSSGTCVEPCLGVKSSRMRRVLGARLCLEVKASQ